MKDLQGILHEIADLVAPLCRQGEVASYIPSLGSVSPDNFGMCVAMADGTIYGAGDWRTPFSIQSISKVFSLALVMSYDYESTGSVFSGSPLARPLTP
ncbi:glutaminase [Arthrobacter psychrolactophilus]